MVLFLFSTVTVTVAGRAKSKNSKGKGPALSLTKKDVMKLMYPKTGHNARHAALDLSYINKKDERKKAAYKEEESMEEEESEEHEEEKKIPTYVENNIKKTSNDNIESGRGSKLDSNENYNRDDLVDQGPKRTEDKTRKSGGTNPQGVTNVRTAPQGEGPKDLVLEMMLNELHEEVIGHRRYYYYYYPCHYYFYNYYHYYYYYYCYQFYHHYYLFFYHCCIIIITIIIIIVIIILSYYF